MNNKSFTLIELLVVIVIIGILAGVIMISTSSSIDKASFAKGQAFSSTVNSTMLSNLISEWLFDSDAVGGKTEDTWGNNDGTVVGADYNLNSSRQCVFGGCYSFVSTNFDYIDCGNYASLRPNYITLSAWIKTGSGAKMVIAHKNGIPYAYDLYINSSGQARMEIDGTTLSVNSVYGTTNINDNEWHHIAGTYDGAKINIYVDGRLEGTPLSYNGGVIEYDTSVSTTIAIRQGAIPLNGLIDDVRIYNAALSSSQIKQNYIAGLNSLLSKGSISDLEYNKNLEALSQK